MRPIQALRMRNTAGAGSSYVETGTLGFTTNAGNNATSPAADAKWGSVITVPAGGVWVKRAYMTFSSGASGVQMRPVLYSGSGSSTDTLFKQGEELIAGSTFSNVLTELGPINWNSDGSALFLPAGNYLMGMMFAASGMVIRNAGGATSLYGATDTYSNGAAATWGTVSGPFAARVMMRIPYSVTGP